MQSDRSLPHTRTRMAWKCLRTTGSRVGSLSSSTGSESAPGAFQVAIARIASPRTLTLPRVILAPRFATALRAAAAVPSPLLYLLDDGWLECGGLGVEQIAEEPLHRRRMSPLSRNRLPLTVLVLDGLLSLCFPLAQAHRPFPVLYRPLMSRCRRSVSSPATYSSKWILLPLYIAPRTSLHAARSAFHVDVVCLALHRQRRSRFLSSAAKRAALIAGRSHHPNLRDIRLASESTACAAPRIASMNSLASSVTLAYYLADVVDELPDHSLLEEFRLQLAFVEWPGLRCLLYTAVGGQSSPKIHSGKPHML